MELAAKNVELAAATREAEGLLASISESTAVAEKEKAKVAVIVDAVSKKARPPGACRSGKGGAVCSCAALGEGAKLGGAAAAAVGEEALAAAALPGGSTSRRRRPMPGPPPGRASPQAEEIAAAKAEAEADLAAAKPALDAALEALNSIAPKVGRSAALPCLLTPAGPAAACCLLPPAACGASPGRRLTPPAASPRPPPPCRPSPRPPAQDIASLKVLKNPPDVVKRIFDCVLLLRCGRRRVLSEGRPGRWCWQAMGAARQRRLLGRPTERSSCCPPLGAAPPCAGTCRCSARRGRTSRGRRCCAARTRRR